ncbi:MAG: hypothetical protein JST93_08795 [Acidobacteria bacterium]|nr:hypothetical protein [Acidobacteriota bacterium]
MMKNVVQERGTVSDACIPVRDRKEPLKHRKSKAARLEQRCAEMRSRHRGQALAGGTASASSTPEIIAPYYRANTVLSILPVSYRTLMRLLKDDPDVRYIGEKKPGVRLKRIPLIPHASVHRLLERLKPN